MGANDHAIVVGISRYPALGDLDGPENDALDFAKWLRDGRGGNVPDANIKLLLSQDFAGPLLAPHLARPGVHELSELFDNWYALGDANGAVGDRLYVYVAGHGFANGIESAALLMANAQRGAVAGRHFPGKPYANWFRQAAFAKEVVLFMDCCREQFSLTSIAPVPYDPRNGTNPARRYFGFATRWSRAAREIATEGGVVRGLFSLALLSGLRGRAQADASGQVRGEDLEGYVVNYLRNARQLAADEEPEFEYARAPDILFNPPPGEAPCNPEPGQRAGSVATASSYVVRVRPSNSATYELVDGSLLALPPLLQSPAEWTWELPSLGLYRMRRSDGVSQTIEVIGDQRVIDVQL